MRHENESVTAYLKIVVPKDKISGLLCTAFEGGSNYWMEGIRYTMPKHPTYKPCFEDGTPEPKYLWVPLNEGGLVEIAIDDGDGILKWFPLTLLAIQSGLAKMSEKHPDHFKDFMEENDDAGTGDVFLQMCLFGEVVYS